MDLLYYIKGTRSGREARDLEREAMEDPFLADALEGYDDVPGDHRQTIERMTASVAERSRTRRPANPLRSWGIVAACLLLAVGGGSAWVYWAEVRPPRYVQLSYLDSPAPDDSTVDKIYAAAVDRRTAARADGTAANTDAASCKVAPMTETAANANSVLSIQAEQAPQTSKSVQAPVDAIQDISASGCDVQKTNVEVSEVFVMALGMSRKDASVPAATPVQDAFGDGATSAAKSMQTEQTALKPSGNPTAQPLSQGGMSAYKKYLKNNMKRIPNGQCSGVSGAVTLQFAVDASGRPVDIKILKPLCPDCDAEAVRLLREGPAWTQSTQLGQIRIAF